MNKPIDKITIQRLLIRMGIVPKSNGYPYLTAAISLMLSLRPEQPNVTSVYARIAQTFGVSQASVERCMRFAIVHTFAGNKLELINEMYNASIITAQPTVSEFLYYVVEYLYTFYPYDDLTFA